MEWISLVDTAALDKLVAESFSHPIVIFKHSTRCSISSMSKSRLERQLPPEGVPFYYLDLIQFRSLSNEIAERFHVHHESPQLLLIKGGECIYDQSHNGITMDDLTEQINSTK